MSRATRRSLFGLAIALGALTSRPPIASATAFHCNAEHSSQCASKGEEYAAQWCDAHCPEWQTLSCYEDQTIVCWDGVS
jgi:hypothetical protein